jgi:hypothetical protein
MESLLAVRARIGTMNHANIGDGRARTPLRAGAAPANRRRARSDAPCQSQIHGKE